MKIDNQSQRRAKQDAQTSLDAQEKVVRSKLSSLRTPGVSLNLALGSYADSRSRSILDRTHALLFDMKVHETVSPPLSAHEARNGPGLPSNMVYDQESGVIFSSRCGKHWGSHLCWDLLESLPMDRTLPPQHSGQQGMQLPFFINSISLSKAHTLLATFNVPRPGLQIYKVERGDDADRCPIPNLKIIDTAELPIDDSPLAAANPHLASSDTGPSFVVTSGNIVYSVESCGRPLSHIFYDQKVTVSSAAFLSRSEAATGDKTGTVRVWDTRSSETSARADRMKVKGPVAGIFPLDVNYIVVQTEGKAPGLYDLRMTNPLHSLPVLRYHIDAANRKRKTYSYGFDVNSGNNMAVRGSADAFIQIYTARDGKPVRDIPIGGVGCLKSLKVVEGPHGPAILGTHEHKFKEREFKIAI